MNDLSNLLITKRTNLKLSLRKAADLIGISHSYLSMLEKGFDPRNSSPIKPTPETLKLISIANNIDYSILMNLAGYLSDLDSNTYKKDIEKNGLSEKIALKFINTLEYQGYKIEEKDLDDLILAAKVALEQKKNKKHE